MSEEESFLLVSLGIHRNQTTARGKEYDVLAWNFRPFQVDALLRRVADDVLQLHDRVHVELGVDLPCLTDVHSSLIRSSGDIAMAMGARLAKSPHAGAFDPLRAQATCFIPKSEHFIR